jgi:hypothetical protein
MQNVDDTTKTWGIVELMGHKVVAGQVSKSEMLGKPLLRVDVPATSTYPEFTQFYGEASIYCVTFVSEEVAKLTAQANQVNPVSVYVPDLVTKEKYEKTVQEFNSQIVRLQTRALGSGRLGVSCTWIPSEQEEANVWTTSCGHEWQLNDGTPKENNVEYCMYCGRSVRTIDAGNMDEEDDEGEPEF